MDIQFSVSNGLNDALFGKCVNPLYKVIQVESDILEKKLGLVDNLFVIEKSRHYADEYAIRSGLDEFMATAEGGQPANDGTETTGHKTIRNISFRKALPITREALEDSQYKLTPEMKRDARAFIGAYYRTRDHIASAALTSAENKSVIINGTTVDLTTYDKLPLFAKAHKWGGAKKSGVQGNLFYLADGAEAIKSVTYLEDVLNTASGRILNMKDENGNAMGYGADTIRVPGNRLALQMYIRKVCGSEYAGAIENATINTQAGKYNIFVDPFWQADHDVIDVMSKSCSDNISGNVFQERTALTVKTTEDDAFNLNTIAYCRFGVGFPEYKHIVRVHLLDKDATMATAELLS